MKRRLCGIAVLVLAAAGPSGYAQSDEAVEVAKRLVVSSGLAVTLESYPKQVEQDVARMRGAVPDDVLNALAEAAKEGYSPARLEDDIVRSLAKRTPVADMKKAMAWLETDVGRRVTRAEERAAASMTPEAMQAYAAETERRAPSARRIQLVADLIAATTAVEAAATTMESIALGIAVGVDAAQPAQKRLGFAALQARVRQAMPPDQVRQSMAAAMPAMYGFIYRDVSDEDLDAYLSFNRSEDGKRYNEAMIAVFSAALARASVRVGTLMEAAAKKKSV